MSVRLRLSRSVLVAAFVVLAGSVASMSSILQSTIHWQWGEVGRLEAALRDPEGFCLEAQITPGTLACTDSVSRERGAVAAYHRDTVNRFPLIAAHQSPIGLAGIVAGFSATVPGALAVFILASSITAGDWSRRTIGPLIARDPRRARHAFRRFLVTWGSALAVAAAVWLVLVLALPLARSVYHLPPSPRGLDMGSFAARLVPRAILAIGLWSALGTFLAIVVRTPLGTFLSGVSLLAVGLAGAGVPATYRFSPAYYVGGWMEVAGADLMAAHLWTSTFPQPLPSPLSSGAALATLLLVLVTGGALALRRIPVPA